MSIWCGWLTIGHDDYDDPDEPLTNGVRGGQVLTYANGFSNHYPDTTDTEEFPAGVSIAHAAPWCVPGHDECGQCYGAVSVDRDAHVGEWVRLDIFGETARTFSGGRESLFGAVVMDEGAARRLAHDLLEWANQPKVHADTEEQA